MEKILAEQEHIEECFGRQAKWFGRQVVSGGRRIGADGRVLARRAEEERLVGCRRVGAGVWDRCDEKTARASLRKLPID